ncbi:hypothetical protein like AT5G36670 [Hibiscus trionum]|uniref:PHD-type domain-containing protein n=1 Tax=Hibiscus trionum TaxID=183268 RepID=A0A9W7MHX9_HIBTR|nr:hypothetical protein like AT5G36670 [Hibiscus trionum]
MFADEGEVCEEAILSCYYYNSGSGRPKKNSADLSLKAKSYLLAKGWVFWYVPKNGKQELRYQSPIGKFYYSLKTACKSFIDQALGSGNVEPKKPKKRKSSVLEKENHPLQKSDLSGLLKRRKTPKKQENGNHDRVMKLNSTKRVGEGLVSVHNPQTLLSWLKDNKAVSMMGNVYYRSKTGSPLMKGWITHDGIRCRCCSEVFTLTAFEAHAGSTNHRPTANIILDDGTGRSLSDCQRQVCDSMSRSVAEGPETFTAVNSFRYKNENDGVCSACCDGGEIICCDYRRSAYHMKCLGLKEVPNGDWFCPPC